MLSCVLVVLAFLAFISKPVHGQYTATIFAGTGNQGYSGDNGPATSADLNMITGTWVDSNGATFLVDTDAYGIRRIDTDGIITTIGGTGTTSGGTFTSVSLSSPWGIAGDSTFFFISDNYHIWRYERSSGIVSILAGTGSTGTEGNGELGNCLLRKIDLSTNIISTVAGIGGGGFGGDGGPATSTNTKLNNPHGVYIDINGVMGTNAFLPAPTDVKGDTMGNIFVLDGTNRLRVVDYATKIVTLKNDDVVQVSVTSRVKFVYGQTLNQVSLETLVSAFQNISDNAQSTAVTSTVLVGLSSPQSVRRGLITSYEMTYHAGYSSSELAVLKTTKVRQAIEVGEFESMLRNLAVVRNAT
eukprot:gene27198-biopygen4042